MAAVPQDWALTYHARQQMELRGIARDQVDAALARPDHTTPSQKHAGARQYVKGQVLLVVNEATRQVITVGIHGASKDDWESFAAPISAAPAEPTPLRLLPGGAAATASPGARRPKPPAAPVQRTAVLDGVHPRIAAAVRRELARRGLDFRAVRVVSPTEVSIAMPGARR
jgi:hypothetical protein